MYGHLLVGNLFDVAVIMATRNAYNIANLSIRDICLLGHLIRIDLLSQRAKGGRGVDLSVGLQ